MWRTCRAAGFPPPRGVVQLIIVKVGKAKRFYAQELSHIMDEEVINDSLQYLKELENKTGRKMPESLLVWLRDAADGDDVRMSSEERELRSGPDDSFSEKISTLKQELVSIPSTIPAGFHVLHQWGMSSVVSTCVRASLEQLEQLVLTIRRVFALRAPLLRCRNVGPFWSSAPVHV